jgi:hypothetical protein
LSKIWFRYSAFKLQTFGKNRRKYFSQIIALKIMRGNGRTKQPCEDDEALVDNGEVVISVLSIALGQDAVMLGEWMWASP